VDVVLLWEFDLPAEEETDWNQIISVYMAILFLLSLVFVIQSL